MAAAGIDFAAEGLLDGLEGNAREQRLELLHWLVEERGATLADLRDAGARGGTLLYLAAGQVLDGGVRYSAREVAESAGVDLELLDDLRRAHGFPAIEDADTPMFGDGDVEAANSARAFLDAGLDREHILATSRVLGRGLTQTAELMRQVNLELALEAGATELQFAQAYLGFAEHLVPMLGPLVEQLLKVHLRQAVQTEALSEAERREGTLPGARRMTIAFADLVGFTRLGEEVEPDALERLARRLEQLTADVLRAPVRMIKTIGDAVMLASPEPAALLDVCFALLAAAEAEGRDEAFPQLRVGLASGEAVARAGDLFGRPVNLASRVTSVARAGSVLATEEVREAIGDERARWSYAHARRLKGVGDVRLFRARPPQDG